MTDKADYMRLLPGDSLKAIGRLELLARTPKEGFVTGRHRSPNKGFSVEFAEHRPYSAGDDLRNLDWRVLGRTDRLYVKEFVEETNMRATILVDASGSMGYAGEAAAKRNDRCLTKFEYAQHLAAALTYLLINQQDAVASVVFDSAIRSYIPARARPSQLRIVLRDEVDVLHGSSCCLGTGLVPRCAQDIREGASDRVVNTAGRSCRHSDELIGTDDAVLRDLPRAAAAA